MKRFFALVGATSLITALAGAPLAWDGAYHLLYVLQVQRPLEVDNRWVILPLHALIIALSRFTDNLGILRFIFSLAYTVLPLVALSLAWWVLQSRAPRLFIWAALGILAGCLPGQFFYVSEAIFALQFFWVIAAVLLTGIERPAADLPLLAGLIVFIEFSHPSAGILFSLAALIAFAAGLRWPERRRLLWAVIPVFLAAAALSAAWIPAYRQEELSLRTLIAYAGASLWGLPLLFYLLLYLAAGVVLVQQLPYRSPAWAGRLPGWLPLALLAAGGAVLAVWAGNPEFWRNALGMRRLVLFTNLPLLSAAVWVAFSTPAYPARREALSAVSQNLLLIVALLSLVVLGVQSLRWKQLSNRLMGELPPGGGCRAIQSIDWLSGTPLVHWGTPSYAVLLQSRAPGALLLEGDGCALAAEAGEVSISPWDRFSALSGWFDFSQVTFRH